MRDNPGPAGQALLRAKQQAETSWTGCWEKKVVPLLKSEKTQRTDLFGFFRFVAQKQEFMEHKNPILIPFTDGQQVGDGFNMERKAPTPADLERAAKAGFVPDLGKVQLLFVGFTPTHGIDNAHWRKLHTFWKEYAKRTGAKSVSISSERIIDLK